MTAYKSPTGEILDIPDHGIPAIEALGWSPVEKKTPATGKPAEKK